MRGEHGLASSGRQHGDAGLLPLVEVVPIHLVPGGRLVRIGVEGGRSVLELEVLVERESGLHRSVSDSVRW